MFNIKSVLSVVMLCSIVSGSILLEGMEKLNSGVEKKSKSREVKEVKFVLESSFGTPFYLNLTAKSSHHYSIGFVREIYFNKVYNNDLFLSFKVLVVGKDKDIILDEGDVQQAIELDRIYLPIRMLINSDGTTKKQGDTIEKIKIKKKNFDLVGKFEVDCNSYIKKFKASSLCEELCCRIEECKIIPNYCVVGRSIKGLLAGGILAVSSDKNGHGPNGFDYGHGPNGFDFSIIRTSE